MKKFLLFVFFTAISSLAWAQPANDECSGAIAMPALQAPGACGAGGGIESGASVTLNTTNVGATPGNPYITHSTCTPTAQSTFANDVWYSYVATGNNSDITVNSSFANPNIAIWYSSCGALLAWGGCAVGSGGTATVSVTQQTVGTTYYIQVSGNGTQSGTFSITMNEWNDCDGCLQTASLTATPQPINNAYTPGQTVNFCFHIDEWEQPDVNWLHGVQLSFGSGWNPATLTTTPPASCAGGGTWAYYPGGITSSLPANGSWPAGFYYDLDNNGNPGDDFGDNCSGTIAAGTWNFCFSIQVDAGCSPGSDLSVTVNTSGDGESGDWTNNACNNDGAVSLSAIGACCQPTMTSTASGCANVSPGTGTATATPVGALGPYDYIWQNSAGTVISTTNNVAGANTISNLTPGTYTVFITDINNCQVSNTVVVTGLTVPNVAIAGTLTMCTAGSTTLTASGASTYSWSTTQTSAAITVSPTANTNYTVIGTAANTCLDTAFVTVTMAGPTVLITPDSPVICSGSSVALTGTATPTGSNTAPVTFTNITDFAIPSNNTTGITSTIAVSGISPATVGTNPIVTVCLNITHTFDGDLDIFLNCPDGTQIELSTDNGGGSNNYTNTCFSSAGSTAITAGSAPFTGTFTPEQAFTLLNACNINGTWSLVVKDDGAGDTGDLNDWNITFNNTVPVTIASYAWTPITNLTPTNTANTTASPTTTTVYTLTATDINGCTGMDTVTVKVKPLPTVTVPANITVCADGTVAATSFVSNPVGATYSWTNTNTAIGLAASGAGDIASFTATNATGSPITGTITVTPTLNGCVGTPSSYTITVNPKPTVTVNSPTICPGGTATLTAAGGTTYSWSTTQTLNPITVTPGATTNYTVIGTTATCSDTAIATVTIGGSLTITVNSPTICAGASATLTASGGTTYSWSTTETTNPISVSPASTADYTVIGTTGGCTGQAISTVTVNPVPTVTVPADITICAPGTVAATNFVSNPAGATYSWTNSNTAIGLASSGAGDVPSFTTTNSTGSPITATISVTPTLGCTGPTATYTITVNPKPVVTVTPPTICPGQTATLTASGATTYSWSTTETTNSISVTPAGTTDYTVIGTTATCSDTAIATATVGGSVAVSVNSPTICNGASATLTASGATTYSWSTSETTNPISVSPASTTDYTVIGTAAGCTGQAISTVTITPTPTVTVPANSTVCANETIAGTSFTSTPAGATYAWTNDNTAIGLAANGTGDIPSFTATNASGAPITATITVTPTTTCPGTPSSYTITVNPIPDVTVNSPTICPTATATLTAMGATTYSWSTTETTNPISVTPASTTNYTVIGTTATCSDTAVVSTVTVGGSITVTVNSPTICSGTSATLTASGGATYSWSTSETTNPISVSPTSTQDYTVIGTSGGCTGEAISTVTVNPTPDVTVPADIIVCDQGTVAGTSFTSTTAGASYDWTNDNTAIGLAASGNGDIASFTATNTTTDPITATITVTPTANGCPGVPSTYTITVNPIPVVTVPADIVVCDQGTVAGTSFTSTTAGATYDWINDNTAIGLATSGNGDVASFTATNTTADPITATITVTPTANSCPGVPSTYTITVNPTPVVTVPADIIVCDQGTVAGTSFTSTTAGATYDWINDNTAIGLAASGNGDIASFTATNTTADPITATISVTATANGCPGGPSTYTITVNPIPVVIVPADIIVCDQGTVAGTGFTSTTAGATYAWTNDNTAIGLAASGNGDITSFNATNTTISPIAATITVTPTANGCPGIPSTYTITVNPTPVVTVPADIIVCDQGTVAGTSFTSTTAGATYDWINDNTAIGLAASGNGDVASFTATNTTADPITATITVTPTANSCPGVPSTYTITVNPTPVVTVPADIIVCDQGTVAGTSYTSTTAGATYAWTNDNTAIGLAASGNGDITSFTATNTTADPITATVAVTPTANGCPGIPSSYIITVNPTPVVVVAPNDTVCHQGATIGTNFTSTTAGATYSWVNDNTAIGLSATGTGNIASFPGTNTTSSAISGTITVTPVANGCPGIPDSYSITVNPLPTADISGGGAICAGATAQVCIVLTGTAPWNIIYHDGTMSQAALGVTTSPHCFNTNTAGTYTVTAVTDGNACGSTSNTGSAVVSILPSPTAVISGGGTVCADGTTATVNIDFTGTGPWDVVYNDGTADITVNAIGTSPYTFTSSIATTYTLVSVSDSNCTGSVSGSATVIVNDLPTAVVSGGGAVCQGFTTPDVQIDLTGAAPWSITYSDGTTSNTVIANSTPYVISAPSVGTYTVSNVTDNNTCSNVASGSATVTINPLPTANAGTDVDICLGTSTTLIGVGGVSCTWSPVPTASSVNSCNANTSPAVTTAYELTVTDANGCIDIDSVIVNVHAIPVADFTSTSVCQGLNTDLTDQSSIAFDTIVSWQWDLGNGNSANTPNASESYAACGNYNVFLTVTSDWNCTNMIGKTVTVYCNPVADFSVDDNSICLGTTSTFTNSSTPVSGFSSDWDFGDLSTHSTTENPAYTYISAGVFPVVLTVTTPDGCTDVSAPQNVTVTPIPVADFSTTAVCLGVRTNFTDLTNANGATGLVYSWDLGDANTTDTAGSFSYLYSVAQDFMAVLTVTSDNGCVSSKVDTVKVNPLPTADFNSSNVCFGTPTAMNFTPAVNPASNYIWDYGNDGTPDATGASVSNVFQNYGTTDVMLTVINAFNCTDQVVKQITVYPNPEASFVVDPVEGCEPLIVNFTSTATVPSPAAIAIYTWTYGDGDTDVGQQFSTSTHTYNAGSYTVGLAVVTDNGCTDSILVANYINSYPLPQAAFDFDPKEPKETEPHVSFYDESIGTITNWFWDFGDSLETSLSSDQNPIHTYRDTGDFCIELIVKTDHSCWDTTLKCLHVSPDFVIYIPNTVTPNDDKRNEFFKPMGRGFYHREGYDLSVYDRWGTLMWRSDDYEKGWDGTAMADGSACGIDVYVYRLTVKDFKGVSHKFTGTVNLVR